MLSPLYAHMLYFSRIAWVSVPHISWVEYDHDEHQIGCEDLATRADELQRDAAAHRKIDFSDISFICDID